MNTKMNRREAVREKIGNAIGLLALILLGLLALMGPSGILAWGDNNAKLDEYGNRISALEEERAVLANRVSLLDADHVDPDLASELVRRDLNVAHKDEYVVEMEPQP